MTSPSLSPSSERAIARMLRRQSERRHRTLFPFLLIAAGVTREEVLRPSRLWTWANSTPGVLWVTDYPVKQEGICQANRRSGKSGGKVLTRAKSAAAKANGKKGGRPPKNVVRIGSVRAVENG